MTTPLVAPAAISAVVDDVLTDFLAACAGLTETAIKIYGPKDDPSDPAPPCVGWTLADESWEPGQHHGKAGSPAALWTRVISITFELFGGRNPSATPVTDRTTYLEDTDRSEALMAKLVNSLHRRLTQNVYRITKGGWGPAIRSGDGMVYLLTIELRLPLVKEDRPTAHISTLNPEVEFGDAEA